MRFIYSADGLQDVFSTEYTWFDWFHGNKYIYNVEDTQDEIIWLINSKESYEEMRSYYEHIKFI